jgi:hypothetical protein
MRRLCVARHQADDVTVVVHGVDTCDGVAAGSCDLQPALDNAEPVGRKTVWPTLAA